MKKHKQSASLKDGLTWSTTDPYRSTKSTRSFNTQDWVQQKIVEGDISGGLASEQSGTSIFDPVLCELTYRWFCPKNGLILDPFAGGSVRGIVAAKMGRRYIGIDLNKRQLEANYLQAEVICTNGDPFPDWRQGDSRNIAELVSEQADLIWSCPPYADLERYSDDPRDLSTLKYEQFCDAYAEIIKATCSRLKQDRFACFVVGDVRDKDGFYYGFPWHTIAAFEMAGLRLYNEAILITAVGSLPIRAARQFESGRKLGKTHQNYLCFIKGDPKKATKACGQLEES
jgi:hypothetical protein